MTKIFTSAEEMARSVSIDPKAFRRTLRAQRFDWHDRYSAWKVVIDSPQHVAMRTVLGKLLCDRQPANAVPPLPASGASLPPNWYSYVLTENVDETRPGIYEWHIDGVGSYVGKYTWISRPKKEYERNVVKLLSGRPYRPKKPGGFRRIHRELLDAHRLGRAITLTILENVDPGLLTLRERELIAERGTLNGG
ncbi:MAG: hypothetical protein E5V85_20430 [Mesorhizobium sp.]|nr:MAG: hypothetical protein E5V85_20430 [Mesorhizobium sp.]